MALFDFWKNNSTKTRSNETKISRTNTGSNKGSNIGSNIGNNTGNNTGNKTGSNTNTNEIITFTDIHCHILPGIDDGAQSVEEMQQMLDIAYETGTRTICFTPHIRRPWLDRPDEKVQEAYAMAKEYIVGKYPDMEVHLGCELYYSHDVLDDCREKIHTLDSTPYIPSNSNTTPDNGSNTNSNFTTAVKNKRTSVNNYLLMEFSPNTDYRSLRHGLNEAISRGYQPVLAHIERYPCLWDDTDRIYDIADMDVLLTVNCDTIVALTDKSVMSSAVVPNDKKFKKQLNSLLDEEMIYALSTDAHDTKKRTPVMADAYKYVAKLCGAEYARKITRENARKLL